jgi:CheY-like chemotaxis protein
MVRVLFIDDEDFTMQKAIGVLRSNKYDVNIKTTGSDALAELRKNYEQYDLVILDLMLPKGKPEDEADRIPNILPEQVGEYIFEKMGQMCPNMPTIILTAVSSNMEGMRKALNARLLMKPVNAINLLKSIEDMLKGSGVGNKPNTTS